MPRETIPVQVPATVEEAVDAAYGSPKLAAEYLRSQKGKKLPDGGDIVTEFCLLIKERFGPNDSTTAFMEIAQVMSELL